MNYRIRIAQLDDVPALKQLIHESSRGLGAQDYTPEQIEGALIAAWGVDTQLIMDETYFAVEAEGGELAGCGGWSYRATLFGNDSEGDRNPVTLDPASEAAKIRAFFVKPSHARQGIGSLIMNTCEEAARAKGFRKLELMATLPGQRLYNQHGFIPEDALEYPLDNGLSITFVPMRKALA